MRDPGVKHVLEHRGMGDADVREAGGRDALEQPLVHEERRITQQVAEVGRPYGSESAISHWTQASDGEIIESNSSMLESNRRITMALRGQAMSHPKTGERVTFGRTAAETDGRFCEVELVATPGTKPAAAHIHPDQVERFTIRSGRVRVRLARGERDHSAGETVVIPPGTPHTWTAVGDEECTSP